MALPTGVAGRRAEPLHAWQSDCAGGLSRNDRFLS